MKQVIQLIFIMLVGTDVCVLVVFMWEETGVPGGNPPAWLGDHMTISHANAGYWTWVAAVKAPFTILVFIFFCSSKLFQIPSQCTVFIFFCSSKLFQIPSQCTVYHLAFIYFYAAPNCLIYHQNACLGDIVIKRICSSKSFQILSKGIFRDIVFNIFLCSSKLFQIPSKCIL